MNKVGWCFQSDQKGTLGRKGLSNANIDRELLVAYLKQSRISSMKLFAKLTAESR